MSSLKQTGSTTADLPVDDPEELDDARYSADMIKEALENISRGDRLSSYERRVAIREVKDILEQLYNDTQTVPSSLKVDTFLKLDESTKTNEQLVVLSEEMMKLMRHAETLAAEVSRLCSQLVSIWQVHNHQPFDLFEVKVKYSPSTIPACPLSLAVLQSMIDVWVSITSQSEPAGADLKTLLQGCGLRQDFVAHIMESVANSPLKERSLAARVAGSLDELVSVQRDVAALDRSPQIPIDVKERSADSLALREEWLRKAKAAEVRIKAWEFISGIPFESSAGPALYLTRSDPSPSKSESRPTFLDELRRAIDATDCIV
ncbi:Hypothetical protein, putative [Bodo saltans]|uniref:Uncharacterized protein n=1 Tax=Bodo saltans TaxID=75058 RepID=A0A0S4JCI7_BODSA|nr:Hypothetical protein, putative [Bodo saltans]|eukprot:CUG89089.1 Hypothetical protein, putative [Bodo saltans]